MLFNHPVMGVALRIKARETGDAKAIAAVSKGLRPRNREEFLADLEDFTAANATPEFMLRMATASPEALGDGTILQELLAFLTTHWADILALILKLLP